LKLVKREKASSWLAAVPEWEPGLDIENAEWIVAVKRWLGMNIFEGGRCRLCNAIMTGKVEHASVCNLGGDTIRRHNAVRDIVHKTAERGGYRTVLRRAELESSPVEDLVMYTFMVSMIIWI